MKLTINAEIPAYPQTTAQELRIGECVRYPMGNGAVRLGEETYLSFGTEGHVIGIFSNARIVGHGYGDLLPKGTTLTIAL